MTCLLTGVRFGIRALRANPTFAVLAVLWMLCSSVNAATRVEELEERLRQYIGRVPGLTLTSISSVRCDQTECEIVFTGTSANPQYVDQYTGFQQNLWRQIADDGFVEFLTGGLGTREIVAGAKEYVMSFTYVAIDSPSTDPYETARQHAACAGA